MQLSLADANDDIDDANYFYDIANAMILQLTKETTWMEKVFTTISSLGQDPSPTSFVDHVFDNEINIVAKLYEYN